MTAWGTFARIKEITADPKRRMLVELAALGAIIAAAAALRLYSLGAPSLWLDETSSVYFALYPWDALWAAPSDAHPPPYYSLVKIALYFGDSEFIVRLPGALIGILTIPVIYGIGRLTFGPKAGLAAALVLALSNVHVEYSHEARMYSVLILGLALAMLGAVGVGHPRSRAIGPGATLRLTPFFWTSLTVYAVGTLIALYSQNIAVVCIAFLQMYALWLWLRHYDRARRFLIAWLGVAALLLVLWIPWLMIVSSYLDGGNPVGWLEHVSASKAFEVWRAVVGYRYFASIAPIADGFALIAILYGVFKARSYPGLAPLLLLIVFAGPAIVWVLGYASPLFMLRTIVWTLIGVSVAIGIAVATSHWLIATGATGALAALGLVSSIAYFDRAEVEDWRGATDYLMNAAEDDDAIVVCGYLTQVALIYYAPSARDRFDFYIHWATNRSERDYRETRLSVSDQKFDAEAVASLQADRVWLVDSHCSNDLGIMEEPLLSNGWKPAGGHTPADRIAFHAYERPGASE